MSHSGTSAFCYHLNHGFIVLKNAQHRAPNTSTVRSTKHNQHYSIQDCCAWLELRFGFGCAGLMWCYATSLLVLNLWFSLISLGKNEKLL